MDPGWRFPSRFRLAWRRQSGCYRSEMREHMVAGLEFMGVKMDTEKNKVRGKETDVSAADSKVKILVIPTDEELMIAKDTQALA